MPLYFLLIIGGMLINVKNPYLDTQLQQAKLFNNSNSGFDVLVASDATGMELNL
ncbi:hypothetical protein C2G38_2230481 [Gigaspora rosea]|uniref:Uncharacterized protein n=1 Tax=Gigaspora rosea TaxID=44941 RepID=A0A397TTV4_9GLOM|nr:hypothetical protein C2G38_2230481 [Gigaspora rosea]